MFSSDAPLERLSYRETTCLDAVSLASWARTAGRSALEKEQPLKRKRSDRLSRTPSEASTRRSERIIKQARNRLADEELARSTSDACAVRFVHPFLRTCVHLLTCRPRFFSGRTFHLPRLQLAPFKYALYKSIIEVCDKSWSAVQS